MFSLSAFLSYAFAVTFSPGPNNIISMSNASKKGFKETLPFILGVFSGFILIMLVASYFNLMLANIAPQIEGFMKYVGAAYMGYLALKILGISFTKKNKTESTINTFKTGFLMQFLNPKVILYGLTITSSFVVPYFHGVELFALSFGLALIAFTATSFWALFGTLLNQLLSKYNRQFNFFMAGLLIYSALKILEMW